MITITPKLRGNLTMLFVATLFGINLPISKALLSDGSLTPGAMSFARMGFGAVAFWLTSLFVPYERVPLRDIGWLAIGSMLAISLNQGIFLFGLSTTSPIDASIIVTSTPMIAMLLAALYLKEPITWQKFLGVIVGATGAILLVLNSQQMVERSSSLIGNAMVVISSTFYASYLVLIKPVIERYSSITVMKWMFLWAALMTGPLFADELIASPLWSIPFSFTAHGALFYIVVMATFVTYALIPVAQKLIRPTTIGMYNYVQPIVASIIAVLAGQDTFTGIKAFCAALIFAGVYMVTMSKSRQDQLREQEQHHQHLSDRLHKHFHRKK